MTPPEQLQPLDKYNWFKAKKIFLETFSWNRGIPRTVTDNNIRPIAQGLYKEQILKNERFFVSTSGLSADQISQLIEAAARENWLGRTEYADWFAAEQYYADRGKTPTHSEIAARAEDERKYRLNQLKTKAAQDAVQSLKISSSNSMCEKGCSQQLGEVVCGMMVGGVSAIILHNLEKDAEDSDYNRAKNEVAQNKGAVLPLRVILENGFQPLVIVNSGPA